LTHAEEQAKQAGNDWLNRFNTNIMRVGQQDGR
jgi:hypothetical protein